MILCAWFILPFLDIFVLILVLVVVLAYIGMEVPVPNSFLLSLSLSGLSAVVWTLQIFKALALPSIVIIVATTVSCIFIFS